MKNLFVVSEHDFCPSSKVTIYFVDITAKTTCVIESEPLYLQRKLCPIYRIKDNIRRTFKILKSMLIRCKSLRHCSSYT
jgi:transposase